MDTIILDLFVLCCSYTWPRKLCMSCHHLCPFCAGARGCMKHKPNSAGCVGGSKNGPHLWAYECVKGKSPHSDLCQLQESTNGELLLTGKGLWRAECELLCCTYTQHSPFLLSITFWKNDRFLFTATPEVEISSLHKTDPQSHFGLLWHLILGLMLKASSISLILERLHTKGTGKKKEKIFL